MPVIFYSHYDPSNMAVPDISRTEHELGRMLLLAGLRKLYGLRYDSPDDIDVIAAEGTGKPYLRNHAEICFNITHCSGLAACAFDELPVGVDAEHIGYYPEVLIERALSDIEKQFFISVGATAPVREEWFWRYWTLKEAYVKRTGVGVDTDLRSVSFSFNDLPNPGLSRRTSVRMMPVTCSDPGVSCSQFMTESRHIISICRDASSEAGDIGVCYIPSGLFVEPAHM